MGEIKIRPLLRKDRKTVAGLIRKMVDKLGSSSLLTLISSDVATGKKTAATVEPETDNKLITIGIDMFKMMLEVIEDDVAAWFADLINVKVEEFDNLPFDIEIKILEQIVEAPEAADFFTGALRLSKKMQGFANSFNSQKQKSGTI
jgi:hypothetical protein